jgi:hypothetical protein
MILRQNKLRTKSVSGFNPKKQEQQITTQVVASNGILRTPFRDSIWPKQCIYQPVGDLLHVWDGSTQQIIKPPPYDWPNPRGKQTLNNTTYWDQTTWSSRKQVLGGNHRTRKSKHSPKKTIYNRTVHFFASKQFGDCLSDSGGHCI